MSKTIKRILCICLALLMATSVITANVSALTYSGSSSYKSGKYYAALTKVELTGNQRTDIVNVAKSQVGYQEGGSSSSLSGEVKGSGNYTEYGRWYGMQDMWCAMFVSWCANVAGISTSIIPSHSYTPTGLTWFKDRGQAYSRSTVANGGYTPKSGDIIYFKSSRNQNITNHIGIVTGYSGGTVYTIEGNTSSATISTNGGAVAAKSYAISNTYIVYICKPAYKNTSTTVTTPTVTYPYKDGNDVVLYDGEATTGITASFNTSVALDTSNKTKGSSSLSMTCKTPAAEASATQIGGMAMQKLNAATDLSNFNNVTFDLYVSRQMTGSNYMQVNFGADGYDGYNAMIDISGLTAGWHTLTIRTSDVPAAVASADWSKVNYLRYTWFNFANNATETTIKIDNVRATTKYPYVANDTLMLYDGESTIGASPAFGATASLSSERKQGNSSLKLDASNPSASLDSGVGGMINFAINTADLSKYTKIHFDLYLGQNMTGSHQFQINFATSGQDGFNVVKSLTDKGAGWYSYDLDMIKLEAAVSGADWANINNLRFTWFNNAKSTTPSYFLIDNVYAYNDTSVTYPYFKGNDAVLYDGESALGLSTMFDTSIALVADSTQGSSSLSMTCNNPAAEAAGSKVGGMVKQNLTNPIDLTGYTYVFFDLYVSRDMVGSNGFQVNFGTSNHDGYNTLVGIDNLTAGWHTFKIKLSDIPAAVSSADWSNINYLRYTWFNYTGSSDVVTFKIDNVYATNYPYLFDGGMMLYDGESTVTSQAHFGATASLSDNKTQGSTSLKLDAANPGALVDTGVGGMIITNINSADLTAYNTIHFDLYVGQDMAGSHQFQVNFATSGQDGYNVVKSLTNKGAGWYSYDLSMADIQAAVSGANWADINTLRFTWFNNAGVSTPSYFLIDNIYAYYTDKCFHTGATNVVGQKEATCDAEGYTGDIYCANCGDLLTTGSVIPANGHNPASVWSTDATHHWKDCQSIGCGNLINKAAHTGGTATCVNKAVCSVCSVAYGAVNAANHTKTEVRGAVAATTTAAGYTGDTYCVDCGTKTATGSVIPALTPAVQVLYNGETLANVSTAFDTDVILSTNKTEGNSALKMTFNDPYGVNTNTNIGGMTFIALDQSMDLTSYDKLCFDLYVSNDLNCSAGFQVNLCTEGSDGYNLMVGIDNFHAGWNTVTINLKGITPTVSGADLSNINNLRLTWFNYAGTGLNHMIVDNMRVVRGTESVAPATKTPVDLGTNFNALIQSAYSGYNLAVSGSNVEIDASYAADGQVWYFVRQADGSYEIANQATDTLLDVTAAGESAGFNVGVYGDNNSVAQRWFIYQSGDYYTLSPVCAPTCNLEVADGSFAHSNVHTNVIADRDSQKFTISPLNYLDLGNPADLGTDFYAKINVASGVNFSLSDTNVITYGDSSAAAQVWKFVRQADGSYKIVNQKSGTKLLEIYGTNAQIAEDVGAVTQRWFIYQVGDKYVLRSAGIFKTVLTAEAATASSNVMAASYTGSSLQLFGIDVQANYGQTETDPNMVVLRKIMYAVETGGQVYGNADYTDFTEAYTNTPEEHAITIGAGQWYGPEAKTLLNLIRTTDPALFASLDTAGIASDLDSVSWSTYAISKTSAKAKCIVSIISTDVGKRCQDQLMDEQMVKFMAEAESLGVTDLRAKMMCVNIRHLGGLSALKRILNKSATPYTMYTLYDAMQSDTGNQVGTFKSRHNFVLNALEKYIVE